MRAPPRVARTPRGADNINGVRSLDGLHTAIFEYFGRELHPAGLAHERPATILEIGCVRAPTARGVFH